MPVTSIDLARICGVSRGTVDRALNNKDRIDPETKARILKVAQELGYRPNPIARSLAKGKSKSIGVVAFDIRNRYFALLLNAIEMTAKKHGYFINITLQENNPELERLMIGELVDRKVDGLLLCPVNKGKTYGRHLAALGVPVITIGNFVSSEIPFIGMDEKAAAEAAVDLMVSKGYRDIIFLCPPLQDKGSKNVHVHEQRLEGFNSGIARFVGAISSVVVTQENCSDWIASRILESQKRTACFCSGDTFALDLIKAFRHTSIRIPQDLGLMGFDGIDTLQYITPSLSTIFNPVEEIGTIATEMMIGLLDGNTPLPANTLVPFSMIEGETL